MYILHKALKNTLFRIYANSKVNVCHQEDCRFEQYNVPSIKCQ